MTGKLRTYIVSIAIALAVGGLAAFFTRGSMDIYGEIATPPLSPPSILFPIVWTVLYILMGISSGKIYTEKENFPNEAGAALRIYALSLVFNFSWSIIFFNLRYFLLSVVVIIGLFLLIVKTISSYKAITPWAAYLQVPYAIWVAFATYLNVGILLLNR